MKFLYSRSSHLRFASIAFGMLMAFPSSAQVVILGPEICPAERSVYKLKTQDGAEVFKISFIPTDAAPTLSSDLYLKLETPQRAYWFTFTEAQGYGGISIWPVSDPHAAPGPKELLAGDVNETIRDEVLSYIRFMSFDKDLGLISSPPQQGADGPEHILLPELGLGLWYSASAFTIDTAADRDPMPPGFFTRSGCVVVPAAKALPIHVE